MDWKTIITSILSASFIVALIDFFIRESYKKLLDKKIEEVKEDIRRKSKAYDLQFNTYILVNELVYRSRNSAREIVYLIKKDSIDFNYLRELTQRLNTYNNAIIEVLYEKRAILTDDIFHYLHELKVIVTHFADSLSLTQKKLHKDKNEIETIAVRLNFEFEKIDKIYNQLTDLVQDKIKV